MTSKWLKILGFCLVLAIQHPAQAQWKADADYPAEALRNNQQGDVYYSLAIGKDGKVKDCFITQGSGYPILDKATCDMMASRAHFIPAKNANGEPLEDTFSSVVKWRLP